MCGVHQKENAQTHGVTTYVCLVNGGSFGENVGRSEATLTSVTKCSDALPAAVIR